MPEKLTTNDAAKILNRAPATVIYYHKIGRLEAERTQSGMRLFSRTEVERLAAKLAKQGH